MKPIIPYDDFLRSKIKVKDDTSLPITAIPDILKPHQKDAVRFAANRGKALLALSFGLGKCVVGETLIHTQHGLIPIENLMPNDCKTEQSLPIDISVQTPTGKQQANFFYNSGINPTIKITTRMGFDINGTYKHPLLVLSKNGVKVWKTLFEIEEGDFVAIQRHNQLFGSNVDISGFKYNRVGKHSFSLEDKLIALNIVSKYSTIKESIREISDTIGEVRYSTILEWKTKYDGGKLENPKHTNFPNLPNILDTETSYVLGIITGDGGLTSKNVVGFTTKDEYIKDTLSNWCNNIGLSLNKISGSDIGYTINSNVLKNWFEFLGISGYSYDKDVPNIILTTTKENIKAYLSGLFDTDGSSLKNGGIEFCSTSEKLAKKVHLLLLQFGIVSRLIFKKNKFHDSWIIQIFGEQAENFYNNIGFCLERKQSRKKFLSKPFNTNIDVIPHLPEYKIPKGYVKEYHNYTYSKESPSYTKLKEMAALDSSLLGLTFPEYFWDEVKTKEDTGLKQTYDICVPNGNAFVANGIVNHNTIIQATLAKIANESTGQKTLTICPLGVRQEFTHHSTGEPNRLYPADIDVHYQYCTSDFEIQNSSSQHIITNYERVRDGNITPSLHNFALVTMDEASIIGNLGTKTYDQFEKLLKDIPFKYVCTATPAPNEFRQLIYYANMLRVRDTGQSLTRWFGRDVNKAGNLQLLPQFEEEFWLWVSTWALFLYKPSDLGYSDIGYELPELKVYWHRLEVDHTKVWGEVDNHGQYKMLAQVSGSVNEMHRDKHRTLDSRIEKCKELVDSFENVPDHNGVIVWHDYEYEREEIEDVFKDYDLHTVYGSQDLEKRENLIVGFQDKGYQILATKPVIAGSGCNFQHWTHRNVFLGVGYKFKDFIQSIHRTYRFMQSYPVEVHIIYSESEDHIVNTLKEKWAKHDKLTEKMQGIVQEYGLSKKALTDSLERVLGITRRERKQELFTAINNDNVLETQKMTSDSIDLVVTSIPFDNHYEYTEVVNDFSFNENDFASPLTSGFWKQMDYLTPELLRITKPGRKAVVHVKDRILYSYQVEHGLTSTFPFSDETVMHFIKHGWVYEGRRTIVTDVVRENNSTYRLGYSEMSKDASKMGSGLPEYLLTFRKPNTDASKQYADERIIKIKYDQADKQFECGNCGYAGKSLELDFNFVESERLYTKYQCPECGQYLLFYSRAKWQIDAHSFWQSNGNVLIPKDWYNYDAHTDRMEAMDFKGNLSASYLQEPPESRNDMVWDDVVFMQCLNSNQSRRKVTNHVCPLPLDIVRRAIILYSNFGETVLDPFAGLFTVPYLAIQLGRIGYGIELNADYYNDGLYYCQEAEQKRLAPTLFDLLKIAEENE